MFIWYWCYMNIQVGKEIYKEYICLTWVLAKDYGKLKTRQLHVLFPQWGYEEGKNWFTKKSLPDLIAICVEMFNLERNFINQVKKEKFVEYLSNVRNYGMEILRFYKNNHLINI